MKVKIFDEEDELDLDDLEFFDGDESKEPLEEVGDDFDDYYSF